MANLSNINNILRTGSLGVGINRDPLGAFEISSATKPGIKMFNTAANGKTYEAYSDVNGNYIIYDQDADDNRFVINSSGNATFAGNVTIATDLVMSAGAINSKNLLFSRNFEILLAKYKNWLVFINLSFIFLKISDFKELTFNVGFDFIENFFLLIYPI